MNFVLANMMLAAQRDDDGLGWIQILIFVIVAVVYALGGLLKSRSSKLEQGREKPAPPQPKRKPPDGRAVPRRPLPTRARRPSFSPAAPAQYAAPGRPPAGKIRRPPPLPAAREQLTPVPESPSPEFAKLPSAILLEQLTEPGAARQAPPEEGPAYLPQLLSDYADPEQLRTAILHYEILGKPLSLRDPSEHIIGP